MPVLSNMAEHMVEENHSFHGWESKERRGRSLEPFNVTSLNSLTFCTTFYLLMILHHPIVSCIREQTFSTSLFGPQLQPSPIGKSPGKHAVSQPMVQARGKQIHCLHFQSKHQELWSYKHSPMAEDETGRLCGRKWHGSDHKQ